MRRGPGIAALDRSIHSSSAYSSLGADLNTSQLNELRSQLEMFGTALRHFSARHRGEIRKNAEFRHAFQKMCYSIGVDPLSSGAAPGSGGVLAGLWNDLLGLGDWQYELGVQIIDVCVSTREINGGVIAMDDLLRRLALMRHGSARSAAVVPTAADITEEDIVRSIKSLAPLGSGYQVVDIGGTKMVRSIPRELDTDTMTVLSLLVPSQPTPFVTVDSLSGSTSRTGWSHQRAKAVLDTMCLTEAMLWIDEAVFPPRYYSPAAL